MAGLKKIDVRIECFGKFSIYRNGRYHPMRNRKEEEMLSYFCCNGKKAVRKRRLEELMWAEAERGKARDSLYKVCAFLIGWQEKEGIELPLAIYREEIYSDTELVALDLQKFWRFR